MLALLHCGRRVLTNRTVQSLNKSYYSSQMAKRVAVVLAGCGVYDGSEIHEASAVLVHLSRGGATVSKAAPSLTSLCRIKIVCGLKCEGEAGAGVTQEI